ncbi:unnamed protein product [Arabidopsis lyrata]|uniref:Predicted protein n=1 Tax=Arabidopsis lyrata subsp. lyrata TaxID=81972 RepID=D7LPF4_ARALL|nr:predicted protein [Arabidopsis lyrata subsp. lyrata]CAH8267282.1 unnamed protein product [Arabidopsis lyrata]
MGKYRATKHGFKTSLMNTTIISRIPAIILSELIVISLQYYENNQIFFLCAYRYKLV